MYFSNVKTLEDLKKEYRTLCFIHHPDAGGTTENMQKLNSEYEKLFIILKDRHNSTATEENKINEMPEEFINIISKINYLDGIEIEICGRWLWISGNTIAYREILKNAGCRWASKKLMWYWHSVNEPTVYHKKTFSIDEIRQKYGSGKIDSKEEKKIA